MRRVIKYDGKFDRRANSFTDAYGAKFLNMHDEALCAGKPCVIHNLTKHSMRKFKLHIRVPRLWDIKPQHAERICPHGVGHPDPDDMAFWISVGESSMGVHGCDGCCK
jgi:hypothetical protein